jgi:hypothetical protein
MAAKTSAFSVGAIGPSIRIGLQKAQGIHDVVEAHSSIDCPVQFWIVFQGASIRGPKL